VHNARDRFQAAGLRIQRDQLTAKDIVALSR
jgi:hypothetical protein